MLLGKVPWLVFLPCVYLGEGVPGGPLLPTSGLKCKGERAVLAAIWEKSGLDNSGTALGSGETASWILSSNPCSLCLPKFCFRSWIQREVESRLEAVETSKKFLMDEQVASFTSAV